ncbi:hypothetical protein CC99x_006150 [Candidatus Berkiella cookevillensis]|uniref:Uncharacterized protein n=1 Tax=Candidatus Berkiella cookevillensis TaxID=437022 RepID=A0A0Q9YSW8_9GAMM|nr:hypothetical protein [Candidatus Berkiella cookevillensis]MCS5708487.1 hypothetical protein [Candidatus Berkiella cookevillensis]
MYELNKNQSALVSGGLYSYIAQSWNENEAIAGGAIAGVVGAGLGGIFCASGAALQIVTSVAIGGITGFGIGYGATMLMNSSTVNNMWYDFNYNSIIFAA